LDEKSSDKNAGWKNGVPLVCLLGKIDKQEETTMHSAILYVLITIIGTVAGQLMLKSGMLQVGEIPSQTKEFMPFFFKALTNSRVILSFLLAFIAAMGWVAAVSKLRLSYAYPFMASTFAIVLVFSHFLFREEIPLVRWIGVLVIWFGVFLLSRS